MAVQSLSLATMNAVQQLSPRHQQVLSLTAQGLTVKEVASQTGRSPHTVHSYLREVRSRLGAGNNVQAVAIALTMGLIAGVQRAA